MTNNAPNEPNSAHTNGSTQQTPRGVYNPISFGGNGDQEQPSWLGELESPLARMFVALLFALIFGIAWRRPEFSPLTILVVVGCLLYRLEPWQREMATAPLLLAAIRFYLLLPGFSTEVMPHFNQFTGRPVYTPSSEYGMPWIPAFLSVCLFFLPRKHSATLKIVVAEALAVVLSSLLPGQGLLVILTILNYTLFFAVTVGLLIDLKPSLQSIFAEGAVHGVPVNARMQSSAPPARPAV
jgi:hypothetical protein